MYQSFKVKNFRCFHELALGDLKRVNLIAGMNNVGKTALLEALFLHGGAYNPQATFKLSAFRGIENVKVNLSRLGETVWDSLFNQFDNTKSIELVGENNAGSRSLRLRVAREPAELKKISHYISDSPEEFKGLLTSSEIAQVLALEYKENGRQTALYMVADQKGVRTEPFPSTPPFPTFFQTARLRVPFIEEAERFGKLELEGKQDELLRVLRLIEPRLKRLAVVVESGETMLQGDIGAARLVPLPLMGEGIARLATLMLYMSNAANGIVLIDEIENGLHHSVMAKVWKAIGEAARQYDTQIFATTHNLECIVAAHRAFMESDQYDFRLHRLERTREGLIAVTYDQEDLAAVIETSLEVR